MTDNMSRASKKNMERARELCEKMECCFSNDPWVEDVAAALDEAERRGKSTALSGVKHPEKILALLAAAESKLRDQENMMSGQDQTVRSLTVAVEKLRRDRGEMVAENSILHHLLQQHDASWLEIAQTIGTYGGYGGVDGDKKDPLGNAQQVIGRVNGLKEALKKAGVFLWNYYREQHKRMDGHYALVLKMAAHEVDAALSPSVAAPEPKPCGHRKDAKGTDCRDDFGSAVICDGQPLTAEAPAPCEECGGDGRAQIRDTGVIGPCPKCAEPEKPKEGA